MPKAKVQEQEVPVEEAPEEPPAPTEEAPEELPPEPIPEVPVEQPVPKPRKAKAPPTAPRVEPKRKVAPKRTNLKDRHTCGACGQEMSLHTALYGHKKCPGKVDVPSAVTPGCTSVSTASPAPGCTSVSMLRALSCVMSGSQTKYSSSFNSRSGASPCSTSEGVWARRSLRV